MTLAELERWARVVTELQGIDGDDVEQGEREGLDETEDENEEERL